MELRHLKYFSSVARERGFGRAATALNLAQPALSRQIKDLEKEVGVALLDRTPKGVDLTPAGEVFLAGASRILSATESALDDSRWAAAGRRGKCTIGVGRIMMAIEENSAALAQLHDELPDVQIAITEVFAADQLPRIMSGELDVGLAVFPEGNEELSREEWRIQDFNCAMLSAQHPLATRKILKPTDLENEPVAFISPDRLPISAEQFRQALERAGITSAREFVYATAQSGVMIVASGRGWAPAPAAMATRPLPGLVVIPVKGLSFIMHSDIVWRRNENRAVVLTVLDVLRAIRDGRPVTLPAAPERRQSSRGLPPALELRHLRYFAAVSDDGGFSRAAERLGVTQPSLSRQVADLEHQVGTQLLSRNGRGVEMTDAGKALRQGVRRVLDELDATLGGARQAKRGLVGRCAVASVSTQAASRFLAATAQACHERLPGVQLILEEYPTPRQPDALREGLVDIGICHAFLTLTDDPHIARERLLDETVEHVLVATDHPLAGREHIRATELSDDPLLWVNRSFHPPFYDRVYSALAGLGLTPRSDATYDSLHLIWALAGQRKGWALGFGVRPDHPPAGLVAVRVDGLHLTWGLDLIWRRHEVNPVVAKVLELMRGVRE